MLSKCNTKNIAALQAKTLQTRFIFIFVHVLDTTTEFSAVGLVFVLLDDPGMSRNIQSPDLLPQ